MRGLGREQFGRERVLGRLLVQEGEFIREPGEVEGEGEGEGSVHARVNVIASV